MTDNYQYIPSSEEDQGIDFDNFSLVNELENYRGVKTQGWNILVRLYVQPEKTKGGLIVSSKIRDEDQYKNCVGLVVQKSNASYEDPRYKQTGHWCKVGDWVVFPRHAGYKISINNIPTYVLKEDAIDLIIDNPTKVSR